MPFGNQLKDVSGERLPGLHDIDLLTVLEGLEDGHGSFNHGRCQPWALPGPTLWTDRAIARTRPVPATGSVLAGAGS
jgi:hypothetical protein